MHVLGVLIGGASSRMGRDKWSLELEGQSFLVRILHSALQGWRSPRVLISVDSRGATPAMRHQVSSIDAEVQWVPDREESKGPLHGLASIAEVLSDEDHLVLVPIDVPLVLPEVVQYLGRSLDDNETVTFKLGERWHPLHAAFRGRRWREQVQTHDGSMRSFHQNLGSFLLRESVLDEIDPEHLSFMNVNTPAELEALVLERS